MRSPEFKKRISEIKQSESDAEETTEKLSRLRLHKPDPETKPVYQLLEDIESNNYLIRPTYQRQEKINVKKASSIIESILLGIKLPPIFIFSRTDGTREVIDGQQRLLSIVGFLGKTYKNEEGQIVTAKNHNFRLKDLRILHQYNGKKYSDIISEIENPFSLNQYVFYNIPSNIRLIVPKGSKETYQATDGWNQFTNIVEVVDGDANGDEDVNQADVENVESFIMGKTPSVFVRSAADMNGDEKIDVVDIVLMQNVTKK